MDYRINPNADLGIVRGSQIAAPDVQRAAERARNTMKQFSEFDVDVFGLLGLRNLSAFVGEVFAASLLKVTGELFRKNPHQDGYPDLLLMDGVGSRHWHSIRHLAQDKGPFSPYVTGGVEIKATTGAVPTPAQCLKRGRRKPGMRDQRVEFLTGYDWKAHHRETNFLMGILWDFFEGIPGIAAVFYSNALSTEDWGKIVQPKEGGGKTTSVSIMARSGVRKMYEGWVLVVDDRRYGDFLNKHNKGDLL